MPYTKIALLLFLLSIQRNAFSLPKDTTKSNNRNLNALIVAESTLYLASITLLHQTWYKNYATDRFHLFNDNNEWQGMDKLGHSFTSYQLALAQYSLLKNQQVADKKAAYWATASSLLVMSSIEIFDAFSKNWGFSWGDMAANVGGASLFLAQELLFKDQYIRLKFSYFPSTYPQYRPQLLGATFPEKLLKDYNAQTYWLSANISSISGSNKIPKWLCFSIGYSASGMIAGTEQDQIELCQTLNCSFKRTNKIYLSFDVDLSKIKTRKKWLKKSLKAINFIKIPFPALYIQDQKIGANWLAF